MDNKVVCVVGPTACGKTKMGVALAQRFGGEVVSVDSMQIYRGMTIGTAAPTAAEMEGVPHHMIAVADPAEQWSAARFCQAADGCIRDILARGRLPVLAGGTGLYLDALVRGTDFAAGAQGGARRRELQQRLAQEGYRQYEISNFACPGHEGRHNLLYWNCKDYWGIGPAAHSCLGSVRRFWPNDTAAFIAGTVQEQYEGPCNAEDYLIMQLRLCSGLNLTEYAARYGVRFDAGQMAFLRHCAASGYAVLDGDTLRLTPSGMIVQNAILEELI